jgi:hypothetical protein
MNKNEIKKELYKQKPIANFEYIENGAAFYYTKIEVKDTDKIIYFQIPVEDMGNAVFTPQMEGALLIRWIK